MGRYDESTRDALANAFERDGFVLLRDHFPRATIEAWRDAFAPLLEPHVDAVAGGAGCVGHNGLTPFKDGVKQAGFADVGTANYGNDWHFFATHCLYYNR